MKTKTNGSLNKEKLSGEKESCTQSLEEKGFQVNLAKLRSCARTDLKDGAVTKGYSAERTMVVDMLNQALTIELVSVLRYRKHYFTAKGPLSAAIAGEFLEHSNEEQLHADRLAKRVVQLGSTPELSPERLLERSHAVFTDAVSLEDMIRENLAAERLAIDLYKRMIKEIGADDPTTRRMLEEILASEESHANELAGLLSQGNQSF